jgi:hypothetical protein
MDDPGSHDKSPRTRSVSSRLPWRYAEIGRRRLASLAAGRAAGGGSRRGKSAQGGVDIDDHIRLAVREESAATLGRAGQRLQEAVAALADFDAEAPTAVSARESDAAARRPLLHEAAEALFAYVVQREAMGLNNHELLDQLYGVTPELWRLMGSAEAAVPDGSTAHTVLAGRRVGK